MVESKVAVGLITKGWSGSRVLNGLVRKIHCLRMAAGMRLHVVFIPSKHNLLTSCLGVERHRGEESMQLGSHLLVPCAASTEGIILSTSLSICVGKDCAA